MNTVHSTITVIQRGEVLLVVHNGHTTTIDVHARSAIVQRLLTRLASEGKIRYVILDT